MKMYPAYLTDEEIQRKIALLESEHRAKSGKQSDLEFDLENLRAKHPAEIEDESPAETIERVTRITAIPFEIAEIERRLPQIERELFDAYTQQVCQPIEIAMIGVY